MAALADATSRAAMRWYNWVLMPLGLNSRNASLRPGWIDATEADGLVLLCRRG